MSENLDLCSKNIHYYQRFWTSSARCWDHAWNLSQCLRLCIHVRNVGFMSENLDLPKNEIQDNPFGSVLQEVGILSGIFHRSPKNLGAAFVWCKIFWSSVSKFIKVLRLWKEYFKFCFCFVFLTTLAKMFDFVSSWVSDLDHRLQRPVEKCLGGAFEILVYSL